MDRTTIVTRSISLNTEPAPNHFQGLTSARIQHNAKQIDPDASIGAGYIIKDESYNRFDQVFTYYSGIYVLRGQGALISAEGKRFELEPGCFFQRIPKRKHTTLVYGREPWHEVFINLPGSLFDALCQSSILSAQRDVLFPGRQEPWVRDVLDFIDTLRACPQHTIPSMSVQAIALLQRIADADRKRLLDPTHQQMEKALALLCGDFSQALSMEAIAREVGIGYECFRKQFKQRYGVSPAQYRIARRVEMAQRFLAAGNSVKDVAFLMGYCDEFAFSKQFKQKTAQCPRAYRNQAREEMASAVPSPSSS